jgi:hypothetical protein
VASALERFLGVPPSLARQRAEIESHLRFRSLAELRATMSETLSHLTQKSGALLGAQAIFLVVDTYGMDHGWPRLAVLISLLTLVFAALLVMTNLKSVYMAAARETDDPAKLELDSVVQLARLAGVRGATFNVALYLTFLSVILLGFGAVEASLG